MCDMGLGIKLNNVLGHIRQCIIAPQPNLSTPTPNPTPETSQKFPLMLCMDWPSVADMIIRLGQAYPYRGRASGVQLVMLGRTVERLVVRRLKHIPLNAEPIPDQTRDIYFNSAAGDAESDPSYVLRE